MGLNFQQTLHAIRDRLALVCIPGLLVLLSACMDNPGRASIITKPITYYNGRAMSGGIITSDGGSGIIQQGVCFGTQHNPTVLEGRSEVGGVSRDFDVEIAPGVNTTYYIRAYAVNGAGIGYGNEISLLLIGVTTDVVLEITATSALGAGGVHFDGPVLSHGLCWSTTGIPTIDDNKTNEGTSTGYFTSSMTGLSPGTTYKVRAYASSEIGVFYGEEVSFATIDFPHLTTKGILNSNSFLIGSGGDILSGGDPAGVCWSTISNPTIADQKTVDYIYYNSFNSQLYGLLPNTTYYVRAYATSLAGTGYGNQVVITTPSAAVYDQDGHFYSAVTIGSQVWLTENLRTSKYSNGETITPITNSTDWFTATSGAWVNYANDSFYDFPYGKLYNWFAVNDTRNICPAGWHASTDGEWSALLDILGGSNGAAISLKESGSMHWPSNGTNNGTNISGFTALPGGGQSGTIGYTLPISAFGLFWSSQASDSDYAYRYGMSWDSSNVFRETSPKKSGYSVRCVKD